MADDRLKIWQRYCSTPRRGNEDRSADATRVSVGSNVSPVSFLLGRYTSSVFPISCSPVGLVPILRKSFTRIGAGAVHEPHPGHV